MDFQESEEATRWRRHPSSSKDERAMGFHQRVENGWEFQADRLSRLTGRDPRHLTMFGDDAFRQVNEERSLIFRVTNTLPIQNLGIWTPPSQIGDLYAQREHPPLADFETIRNPLSPVSARFLRSDYYKKRARELRPSIEKIRSFEPHAAGLIIIGRPPFPEIAPAETFPEGPSPTVRADGVASIAKLSMRPHRILFRTSPGVAQSRSVRGVNEGTTAVYYRWEVAPDIEITADARDAQSTTPFNVRQKEARSEFCFSERNGSIRPGCSLVFELAFKSLVPGCFAQRWIMRTTPHAGSDSGLSVALRGCCAVDFPNLDRFKESIDASLHESERSR
jgi:hypothetical protein